MRLVHWHKIILVLLLGMPVLASAQFTVREYENRFSRKPYHFGIALSYNTSYFKIDYDSSFLNNHSVLVADGVSGPGFNLGIVGNLKLNDHFDFRFIPGIAFSEKTIQYEMVDNSTELQRIESIYFNFPFSIKFKSDAYKDMKVYVIAGATYSYDLASNAKARNADDILKITTHDVSADYGFGFEFYFPYFIFSPEIRICNGVNNMHFRDPNLIYSSIIDKLFARSILFTIHLEG